MKKTKSTESQHFQYLTKIVRKLVTERYKNMAKDDSLFKFISSKIDPTLLIDQSIQAEKEALHLAEMSLFELVGNERMGQEVRKAASYTHARLLEVLKGIVSENEELLKARERWLTERIVFYRRWLSLREDVESPTDLAWKVFRSRQKFEEALEPLQKIDRDFGDSLVKSTSTVERFLMKKHIDNEMKSADELWHQFADEVFKETRELR